MEISANCKLRKEQIKADIYAYCNILCKVAFVDTVCTSVTLKVLPRSRTAQAKDDLLTMILTQLPNASLVFPSIANEELMFSNPREEGNISCL